MTTEEKIVIKRTPENEKHVGWLLSRGAKIVTITSAIIVLAIAPEILNAATKEEVKTFLDGKDGITPGQKDSIQYTGTDPWYLTLGDMYQNDGQNVKLFCNNFEVPFNEELVVGTGDIVKIEGITGQGVDDFRVGNDRGNIVTAMPTPLNWLSVDAYVKEGKIRVDAEIAQARNVDRIEMQAGLRPKELAVVDSKKVENGEAPQTFNFEMPIDEFIKKHNITSPTVVYVRLQSHDKDNQTQETQLQAVEIHPDGKVISLKMYPNIAEVADKIKFVLPGDTKTAYPVRVVNLTTAEIVGEGLLGGGEHTLREIVQYDLTPGSYAVQVMTPDLEGKPGKFVITD